MTNFPQLQSQIESEAVADYEKVFPWPQSYKDITWPRPVDDKKFKEWLQSTIHQATQRVAEETAREAMKVEVPNELGSIHAQANIKQGLNSWLNHNSEDNDMVTIETRIPVFDEQDGDCPYCSTSPITPHAHKQDMDRPFHLWRGV